MFKYTNTLNERMNERPTYTQCDYSFRHLIACKIHLIWFFSLSFWRFISANENSFLLAFSHRHFQWIARCWAVHTLVHIWANIVTSRIRFRRRNQEREQTKKTSWPQAIRKQKRRKKRSRRKKLFTFLIQRKNLIGWYIWLRVSASRLS